MNPPAGFWRRYAAYSLDAALVGLLALPLCWSRYLVHRSGLLDGLASLQRRLWELLDSALLRPEATPLTLANEWAADPALRAGVTTLTGTLCDLLLEAGLIYVVLAAAWFIASEASPWQASPGKRIFGLRVTDMSGARAGPGRIAGRFFGAAPSWLLLNLGHAIAAWTPGKRALHDYLAGTRVELAPSAPAAMPRGARAWLWLQAALYCGLLGFIVLRYVQLLWEVASGGLA
ncbi:RDD family protein [Arenimonas daejeonensis]|uniref:RDD family protein n=1 Tax=Arenimonas daejeonensis TaxID=370777 RepID=UPI0011BFE6EC|nr:RDD family protein [Arenimonas daejeonensis]